MPLEWPRMLVKENKFVAPGQKLSIRNKTFFNDNSCFSQSSETSSDEKSQSSNWQTKLSQFEENESLRKRHSLDLLWNLIEALHLDLH